MSQEPSESFIKLTEAANYTEAINIKLLLDKYGIPYFTKNEHTQNLFGLGSLGGYNFIVGAIEFYIPDNYAEAAIEALNDYSSTDETDDSED